MFASLLGPPRQIQPGNSPHVRVPRVHALLRAVSLKGVVLGFLILLSGGLCHLGPIYMTP